MVHSDLCEVCRSYVLPTNAAGIPTGVFKAVEGTPFDFNTPTSIGSRSSRTGLQDEGYDINYVLWGYDGPEAKAAVHDCIVFDT